MSASQVIIKKSLPRRVGRSMVVGIQVLCAVHFFNEHIAEIRPCTGASMYPTLALSGTYVLQSRLPSHSLSIPSFSSPSPSTPSDQSPFRRGMLVTALSPLDPTQQILKRVIGIAGDTICVDPSGERARVRRLERMGREPREGDIEEAIKDEEPEWIVVPRACVWLGGDNASNSIDSRDYGPVPLALLRGHVVARVWPNPTWYGSNMRSVRSP